MSEPTLYRRCAHYGNPLMQAIHECDGYVPVEPEAIVQAKLMRDRDGTRGWEATYSHYELDIPYDAPMPTFVLVRIGGDDEG